MYAGLWDLSVCPRSTESGLYNVNLSLVIFGLPIPFILIKTY
jgi:hypothetical protein